MARLARVVVPDCPHHIIQRGNRRQDVFFCEEDYLEYLDLISYWCWQEGVDIWNYCLMTNHVHLIVTPREHSNLSRAIGEAHKRYTRHINFRENWRGYLWQGRFSSFPMEENYLLAASAYVELNPVRAGMVKKPWDYRWSSVHAYLSGQSDGIVTLQPLRSMVSDWRQFLNERMGQGESEFEQHERTGRPLGSDAFIRHVSQLLGRDLMPKKPGPRPKTRDK